MKKILFTLLLSLVLIPGVKADCINLVDDNVWYQIGYSGPSYYTHYSNTGTSYTRFTLDTTKTYTIYFEDLEPICDTCILYFFGTNTTISNDISITATPTKETDRLYLNTKNLELHNSFIQRKLILVEGDSICTNEPEEPEEPVVADTTLDTFYTIYLNKLTELSTFAIENKFVLSAITIVIFVCCLELFLYLVNRRKR